MPELIQIRNHNKSIYIIIFMSYYVTMQYSIILVCIYTLANHWTDISLSGTKSNLNTELILPFVFRLFTSVLKCSCFPMVFNLNFSITVSFSNRLPNRIPPLISSSWNFLATSLSKFSSTHWHTCLLSQPGIKNLFYCNIKWNTCWYKFTYTHSLQSWTKVLI